MLLCCAGRLAQADLLLARVYAAWPGHTNDALKVYDSLIAEFPDDFRGYLAKVVRPPGPRFASLPIHRCSCIAAATLIPCV